MRKLILSGATIALGLVFGSSVYSDEPTGSTRATFQIMGLHCPPCTNTVQTSLSRVKGINSVVVDWNAKNAKVVFDESVLPAQALASAIDRTPHMMGASMRYSGWLALKVPSITDEASGKKVKDLLSKVDGVKTVAVDPAQHSAAVLFGGKGTTSSKQIIDALAKDGIEAINY